MIVTKMLRFIDKILNKFSQTQAYKCFLIYAYMGHKFQLNFEENGRSSPEYKSKKLINFQFRMV